MTRSTAIESEVVHERIVEAVATLEGTSPVDLPPLFEAVDPDALEAIFAPTRNGQPRRGRIEFPYAQHTITVEFDDDHTIRID